MRIVNKLSPKTLKVSPKMVLVEVDGKQLPRCDGDQVLFRVIGRAIGYKVGNTEYGQFTKFQGDFRAFITSTGEEVRSSECFLPDMVAGALKASLDASTAGADFAFDIGATAANTATGYQYTVTSLIEPPKESDPLAGLLAQVAPLALVAPAAPEEKVTLEETVENADALEGKKAKAPKK